MPPATTASLRNKVDDDVHVIGLAGCGGDRRNRFDSNGWRVQGRLFQPEQAMNILAGQSAFNLLVKNIFEQDAIDFHWLQNVIDAE